MRKTILLLLACSALVSASPADVPVFEITPVQSTVKFDVEASVAIVGKFSKWEAKLTFTSPEVSTGVLDVKIQAASVDTGSGTKNGKIKGKDFFDVERNPLITFRSTKAEQTGPNTVVFDGDFTIRGVTKKEKVTFTVARDSAGTGTLKGSMAFDRKQYGMNSGIPFIKIADKVQVDLDLYAKRTSGPAVNLK